MYILAGEKWDGAMDFCCQGGAIDSENYCAAQVSQVHEEYRSVQLINEWTQLCLNFLDGGSGNLKAIILLRP